jgi:2,4-dienoyl-CoA reductase-like NADH-dependent reductase (Old Yellow Enzyme family)
MTIDKLFKQVDLGAGLILNNRVVMAPLTRCMADNELVPTQAMAEYYARRADTGLIITEATLISQSAQGYPNTPGLYNQQQVDAWKEITQRVHQNGGKIFAQLWHTGRVSHPNFLNGEKPMAPSALAIEGHVPRMEDLHYGEPQKITPEHIKQVITDFALAAANAKKAGFDGVEIHGANGYLIDQFLHFAANEREDEWGQTPENMSRLLFDLINVVKK